VLINPITNPNPVLVNDTRDNMKVRAIVDSGSEVNLLAQSVHDKLIDWYSHLTSGERDISDSIWETI
jgi:urate oxidase